MSDEGGEDGPKGGDSGPFGIEKAKYALCCCCIGILLLPAMLIMLGANEKGYVCRHKDIINAEKNAKEVGCSGTPPNDQFVFFSCEIDAAQLQTFKLGDFNAGFVAPLKDKIPFKSVAASQTVEMYQCMESSSQKTDPATKQTNTTYSYRLGWSSQPIAVPSGGWGNLQGAVAACGNDFNTIQRNPGFPSNLDRSSSTKRMSGGVPVGMFKLHAGFSDTFQADTPVSLSSFASTFRQSNFPNPVMGVAPWVAPYTHPPITTTNDVRVIGNFLMTCNTPRLGCVRISLKKNGATYASAFANSGKGGNTAPQPTKSSWGCSSGKFAELFKSRKTKAEAIDSLSDSNYGSLWAMRIIGVLLCWAAVFCCMYPIIAAFDIVGDYLGEVPCVGWVLKMIADIIETLVKIVVCCMSCSFGCSCAFFVIAVVWVVMRPTVGIIMLLIVVVLSVGACVLMKLAPKKGGKVQDADEDPAEAS